MLRETGGVLGGETSGHILCLDKTTTGDGLVSALQVLAIMKQTGRELAELAAGACKLPAGPAEREGRQALRSDRGAARCRRPCSASRRAWASEGRVVLRASGTEPVIRVMVEGRDETATRAAAEELAEVVSGAAA